MKKSTRVGKSTVIVLTTVIGLAGCNSKSVRNDSPKAVSLDQTAEVAWVETKVQKNPQPNSGSAVDVSKYRKSISRYSSGEIDKSLILEGIIVGGTTAWFFNCIKNEIKGRSCKKNEGAAFLSGVAIGGGAGYFTALKTAQYKSESDRLSGLVLGAQTELRAARDTRKASLALVGNLSSEIESLASTVRTSGAEKINLREKLNESRRDLQLLEKSVVRMEDQRTELQAELSKSKNSGRRSDLQEILTKLTAERDELQRTINLFLGTVRRGEAALT